MEKNKQTPPEVKRKNRKKFIRTFFQIIFIFIIIALVLNSLLDFKKYTTPDKSKWDNNDSFIAVSYFGVDWNGSAKRLSRKEIRKQISHFKKQGYETISTNDIINFYENNTPLPKKALYLAFEDGRNDSSLFVHPLLRKFNYKATILTYANRLGDKDHKFLQPKDLLHMKKGGYWEFGSNGYRLSYINVVDDHSNYLGFFDEKEIPDKVGIEYYNHYLMDYLRDEKMLPVESKEEMQKRISNDYTLIRDIYSQELGEVPPIYMIMHANTMYQSMSKYVEEINDLEIKKTFKLHFNRDGIANNSKKDNIYNLSRLQVAPFWSTNQMIMHVNYKNKNPLSFIVGDLEQSKSWTTPTGAVEFENQSIILTSNYAKESKITLNQKINSNNLFFETNLKGGLAGVQSIKLSNNEESSISISISNDDLYIEEKKDDKTIQSIQETLPSIKWEGKDYAFDKAKTYSHTETQEGSRVDEESYPITVNGNRKLKIVGSSEGLKVTIGEKDIMLRTTEKFNKVSLLSKPIVPKTDYQKQSNILVYDAVFEDVIIKSNDSKEIIFTTKKSGVKKINYNLSRWLDQFIGKMINVF